jgi:hypothetical protein
MPDRKAANDLDQERRNVRPKRRSRRTPAPKATRIVTWEEFDATPRTVMERASYHPLLRRLQAVGLVDEDLNLTDVGRRTHARTR